MYTDEKFNKRLDIIYFSQMIFCQKKEKETNKKKKKKRKKERKAKEHHCSTTTINHLYQGKRFSITEIKIYFKKRINISNKYLKIDKGLIQKELRLIP